MLHELRLVYVEHESGLVLEILAKKILDLQWGEKVVRRGPVKSEKGRAARQPYPS